MLTKMVPIGFLFNFVLTLYKYTTNVLEVY